MAWWSRWLVHEPGARKELSSLGGGPEIEDTAPLIPSQFNCTTFVETVSALARSERPQLFFQRLIEIRYRGAHPGYLTRNHFPEADWIPNNAQAGILADVTAQVADAAGVRLKTADKTIDRAGWLAEQKRRSAEISRAVAAAGSTGPEWSGSQSVKVTYITHASFLKALDKVPDGTIIGFMRKSSTKRPGLIAHQGIVVRREGGGLASSRDPRRSPQDGDPA